MNFLIQLVKIALCPLTKGLMELSKPSARYRIFALLMTSYALWAGRLATFADFGTQYI